MDKVRDCPLPYKAFSIVFPEPVKFDIDAETLIERMYIWKSVGKLKINRKDDNFTDYLRLIFEHRTTSINVAIYSRDVGATTLSSTHINVALVDGALIVECLAGNIFGYISTGHKVQGYDLKLKHFLVSALKHFKSHGFKEVSNE